MGDVQATEAAAKDDALASLGKACSALRAAQATIDAAVMLARGQGATWAQIGSATGMTRQAAHERWGHAPREGCRRSTCDCPHHQAYGCGCGHGPGRGYRAAPS